MDVWCVSEGWEAKWGLVQSFGCSEHAKVVRRGRLRWFGHVERKNGDDWVSACRNVVVAGVRCVGRGRKTWRECVKDDTDELGLHPEWAVFKAVWRGLISGQTSNPSWAWKRWTSVTVASVGSARTWDGTGCEFDSWQCRIYIPCS